MDEQFVQIGAGLGMIGIPLWLIAYSRDSIPATVFYPVSYTLMIGGPISIIAGGLIQSLYTLTVGILMAATGIRYAFAKAPPERDRH